MTKSCSTCLWYWRDLGGGVESKCYGVGSPQYHKSLKGSTCACKYYEIKTYIHVRGGGKKKVVK